MPVLRKLVSRFSFETDKKSVNNYFKSVGSMKSAALKLGSVLGAAFGAKQLFGIGVSAKQAESDLKRLAGSNLGNLNAQLNIMKQRLDNVQEGASSLARKKTIDVLGAGFFEKFGAGNEQIKTFVQLLETASLQSLSTGKTVEETFAGISDFISTGGAAGLLGIGGITLRQQKAIEARAAAIDPSEFGTEAGRRIRTEMLLNVINQVAQEQRRQAANLDKSVVSLAIASNTLKDGTEKASEAATEATILAGAAVVDGTKSLFEEADKRQKRTGAKESPLIDIVEERAKNKLSEAFEGIGERVKKREEEKEKLRDKSSLDKSGSIINLLKSIGVDDKKKTQEEDDTGAIKKEEPAASGAISRVEFKRFELPIEQKEIISDKPTKIEVNNTFHITEVSDAKAIANEVKSGIQNAITEAKRQLIPSEDKSQ